MEKTILLVEDDDAYRYALAKQLRDAGFTVVDTPDFSAALDRLDRDDVVHLLIADIRLPKDTPHGFSIARMARHKRPWLPVLFVTAYDPPREEADFGNSKILSKQLSLDVIVLEAQTAVGVAG